MIRKLRNWGNIIRDAISVRLMVICTRFEERPPPPRPNSYEESPPKYVPDPPWASRRGLPWRP